MLAQSKTLNRNKMGRLLYPFLVRRLSSSTFPKREAMVGCKNDIGDKDLVPLPTRTIIHGMNVGQGPRSYAKNSLYQREIANSAREIIQEQIARNLDIKQLSPTCTNGFCIADFGCSTGHNSFLAIQSIIQSVKKKFEKTGSLSKPETPECFAFFNDVCTNDFNTLFTSLPPNMNYRAAGLPGDFRNRLLLKSSLHFAYCSCSLHWLSEVPKEVTDPTSTAWNKGAIHCTWKKNEVCQAYSNQHAKEVSLFLEARAQELVVGGMMVLVIPAIPSTWNPDTSYTCYTFLDLLNSCVVDMVNKGIIKEDLVDSFNMPWHSPTPEEAMGVIKNCKSFEVETMELLKGNTLYSVNTMRATCERLFINHFGNAITDELFDQFSTKVEATPLLLDPAKNETVMMVVVLKRV